MANITSLNDLWGKKWSQKQIETVYAEYAYLNIDQINTNLVIGTIFDTPTVTSYFNIKPGGGTDSGAISNVVIKKSSSSNRVFLSQGGWGQAALNSNASIVNPTEDNYEFNIELIEKPENINFVVPDNITEEQFINYWNNNWTLVEEETPKIVVRINGKPLNYVNGKKVRAIHYGNKT